MPLLRLLGPPERLQERGGKESRLSTLIKKVVARKPSSIVVKGMDGIFIRRGNCCPPGPGDPLIGFITRGRGVTVHTRECQGVELTRRGRRRDLGGGTKAVHP
jgi:GTP pyrophosphokinase